MHRLPIVFLLLQWCFVHPLPSIEQQSPLSLVSRHVTKSRWNEIQRGGGSSVDEEEEEIEISDAEDEEVEESDAAPSDAEEEDIEADGQDVATQAVQVAGKTTLGFLKASIRAFSVAFSSGSGDAGVAVLGKIARRLTQYWKALVSSSTSEDEEGDERENSDGTSTTSDKRDFANYLASAYNVKATRNNNNDAGSKDETSLAAIAGGSIQDALQLARSQSRLLLVLIPANRPDRQTAADKLAIESFLSIEAAKMAEKRAHKNIPTPSFLLWSAKVKSPEAVVAAKRLSLELNPKRPILLVATSKTASSSCRVLAQHHCNPPPNATTMASWLNAIRKRHKKLYQKMQRVQTELQIAQERVEGYRTSMVQERQRQIDLQTQKEQEEARAQAAAAHAAAIQQRRTGFAATLPDPTLGTMTLALRFADGTSHQRQFDPETATLETVFNWADVVAEQEREKVVLTTLNGKQSFAWEEEHCNRTLGEMGWGKMIAFRVTETACESASPTA